MIGFIIRVFLGIVAVGGCLLLFMGWYGNLEGLNEVMCNTSKYVGFCESKGYDSHTMYGMDHYCIGKNNRARNFITDDCNPMFVGEVK